MVESNLQKRNSFVVQAGILAAAGMIVKIISLIYRSPLLSIIGLEGNNYYSAAINIYTIILLISSYSIPSAISKVIAQRLAFKEYRNAQRVFQCALLYVLVVGGAASLFTFFMAPVLVSKNPNAVTALRVLAPTIFFSGFLGVFRGYFQAHRSMLHTSISQVLEQIVNASVSIGAAHLLIGYVSNQGDTVKAVYGSAGSALGTGAGVVTGLLFMLWVYYLNRSLIHKRIKRDVHSSQESYRDIFKVIFTIVTPFILSTFIYNCSTVVNMNIFYVLMDHKKIDTVLYGNYYGIFATQAVAVINIPVAIASAMSSATIPSVSASFVKGEYETTRRQVSKAIQLTMLVSIPSSIGVMVLSKPIMQFIFPQKESLDMAASLLAILGITVVTYGLSTLTNAVLQGIGKVNTPVIHSVIALVIQIAGLVALLLFTDMDTYGLAVANIIYSFVMCLLNQLAVKKYLGYRMDYMKIFVKPYLAAVVMGATAWGVYHGIYSFWPISRVVLIVAIGIAAVVYFLLLLVMGAVTEEEILAFPKGRMLLHYINKFHLLKPEKKHKRRGRRRRRRRRRRRVHKTTDSVNKKNRRKR